MGRPRAGEEGRRRPRADGLSLRPSLFYPPRREFLSAGDVERVDGWFVPGSINPPSFGLIVGLCSWSVSSNVVSPLPPQLSKTCRTAKTPGG